MAVFFAKLGRENEIKRLYYVIHETIFEIHASRRRIICILDESDTFVFVAIYSNNSEQTLDSQPFFCVSLVMEYFGKLSNKTSFQFTYNF